jgi:hypothetical protein
LPHKCVARPSDSLVRGLYKCPVFYKTALHSNPAKQVHAYPTSVTISTKVAPGYHEKTKSRSQRLDSEEDILPSHTRTARRHNTQDGLHDRLSPQQRGIPLLSTGRAFCRSPCLDMASTTEIKLACKIFACLFLHKYHHLIQLILFSHRDDRTHPKRTSLVSAARSHGTVGGSAEAPVNDLHRTHSKIRIQSSPQNRSQ